MKNLELKEKLVLACKDLQAESIKNLETVVAEAQKGANEYGTPKDRYDSYRTQLLRKRDMFAQQLAKTVEQMDVLDRISLKKCQDKIEFGAIVITDKQKLFLSIGLGKIKLDEQIYYAISPIVPISKALEGKKAGEEIIFNENKIKILEVF